MGWAEIRGRADASKVENLGSASARPRLGALAGTQNFKARKNQFKIFAHVFTL